MTNLVLHYNFENYVAGSNTIVYKGTTGSAYNATIGGNASVINTDHATGTSCLSLIGEGTSSGGYLQIPNFRWSPSFYIAQHIILLVSGIRNLQRPLPKQMHAL